MQDIIQVREEVFLRPFKTIGVKPVSKLAVKRWFIVFRESIPIILRIRTPMQRRKVEIIAPRSVSVVISSRFQDIDFSGSRPFTISIDDGQHPDGGPEPVAFGDFGFDFDAAIFYGGAKFGVNTAREDGLDDGAVCGVCG